ncbi:MAG: protein-methionine-sulfoxide reductase catalytic subunit MsrP [Gammaproteobacteria bacterium]|nr:protein-methionine-sulfoxide reductase catalytic subunit MsrP [Gammaproteobacteria bacterium]
MLIKKSDDILPSEITDKNAYLNRRQFLKEAGLYAAAASAGGLLLPVSSEAAVTHNKNGIYKDIATGPYTVDEKLTSYKDVTSYNNFYEFGTQKGAPRFRAAEFKTRPWKITVEGECEKPGMYDLEDFLKTDWMEERIYRFRCVEAWSMVVPWIGFELNKMLKQFQPNSKAKYVEFETLYDPKQMPGQERAILDWPYTEGLRIDEAMHPLTIMVVGLYGDILPNQNGAPLRLMVPWKYGFKSIKSIAKIRFTEKAPVSSWMKSAPSEYGFYSNVNPNVAHPRWSQARERRLGEDGFFSRKRKTLMFNGYGEQVASLYSGMDLSKHF